MKAEILNRAWRRRPFRPLLLSLDSGETVRVAHPETLVVGKFTAVWMEPETDRTFLMDIASIAKIEIAGPVPSAGDTEAETEADDS